MDSGKLPVKRPVEGLGSRNDEVVMDSGKPHAGVTVHVMGAGMTEGEGGGMAEKESRNDGLPRGRKLRPQTTAVKKT